MGADVYLKSIYDSYHEGLMLLANLRQKYSPDQEKIEEIQNVRNKILDQRNNISYFRDSYNSSSLMAHIGLSWWNDISHMLYRDSFLSIKNAIKLRNILYKKKSKIKNDFFEGRRKALIKLLSKSITMKEKLYISY